MLALSRRAQVSTLRGSRTAVRRTLPPAVVKALALVPRTLARLAPTQVKSGSLHHQDIAPCMRLSLVQSNG